MAKYVENAIGAHLLAEEALAVCHLIDDKLISVELSKHEHDPISSHLIDDNQTSAVEGPAAAGRAHFITNGEPVVLCMARGLAQPRDDGAKGTHLKQQLERCHLR